MTTSKSATSATNTKSEKSAKAASGKDAASMKSTAKGAKSSKSAKGGKITVSTKYGDLRFNPETLQLVEGIGPKIEQLLHAAGYMTLRKLSQASSAKLEKVLSDAGSRFQMHDPSSWAQQAGLAADAKWNQLIKLQRGLDAGKSSADGGESPSKLERFAK